jgi:hypothetical protein
MPRRRRLSLQRLAVAARKSVFLMALGVAGGCRPDAVVQSVGDAKLALEVVFAEGTSAAQLDQVRIIIEGPTPRSLTAASGTTQTIEGPAPGTYTVALEGMTSGSVEQFGERTGVSAWQVRIPPSRWSSPRSFRRHPAPGDDRGGQGRHYAVQRSPWCRELRRGVGLRPTVRERTGRALHIEHLGGDQASGSGTCLGAREGADAVRISRKGEHQHEH